MKKMDFLIKEMELLAALGTDLELSIDRLQEQKWEIARRIEENTKKRLAMVQKVKKKRTFTVVTKGDIL